MKKRLFAILAGCLSLLMLLSACGEPAADPTPAGTEPAEEAPGGAEAEPVTITYCNFNSSGGNEETLQRMYEAFHEEYPNITVEIETIAIDDYFTQMQTRVAGGTAPDCYEMNIENFASYASRGRPRPDRGRRPQRPGRDGALRLRGGRRAVRPARQLLQRRAGLQQGPL